MNGYLIINSKEKTFYGPAMVMHAILLQSLEIELVQINKFFRIYTWMKLEFFYAILETLSN